MYLRAKRPAALPIPWRSCPARASLHGAREDPGRAGDVHREADLVLLERHVPHGRLQRDLARAGGEVPVRRPPRCSKRTLIAFAPAASSMLPFQRPSTATVTRDSLSAGRIRAMSRSAFAMEAESGRTTDSGTPEAPPSAARPRRSPKGPCLAARGRGRQQDAPSRRRARSSPGGARPGMRPGRAPRVASLRSRLEGQLVGEGVFGRHLHDRGGLALHGHRGLGLLAHLEHGAPPPPPPPTSLFRVAATATARAAVASTSVSPPPSTHHGGEIGGDEGELRHWRARPPR